MALPVGLPSQPCLQGFTFSSQGYTFASKTPERDWKECEMAEELTVSTEGPPRQQRQRFSMWEELFEECRAHQGKWRRTKNYMRKSSAAQLSSDIRNAHKRESAKSRLHGLRANEVWDAAWGEGEEGKFYLWIKYDGTRP